VHVLEDARAEVAVRRIAVEEFARLARDLRIGVPVIVVGAAGERREAAGHEDLAQALRMQREISDGAEASVTLAERAPRLVLADERAADQLGVAHDAVRAEVHQIAGLRARVAAAGERLRQHHGAAPVAARIEQEHVVVVQCALDPAAVRRRPRCGKSGTALREDEPWPLLGRLLALLHRPRKDRQCFALRPGMVEGDVEFEVGQLHPVVAGRRERAEVRHGCSLVNP
jgi:hypothetical protein